MPNLSIDNFKDGLRLNSYTENSVVDCQNVYLTPTGAKKHMFRKMAGNTNVLETALTAGIKLIKLQEKNENDYLLAYGVDSSEGFIYKYNDSNFEFDEKKNGLSITTHANMVEWQDGIVISNGTDDLMYFEEGASPNEIVDLSAVDIDSNPVRGLPLAVYDGRLWVGSGNVLVASALGDATDFGTVDDSFLNEFDANIIGIEPYSIGLVIYLENQTVALLTGGGGPSNYSISYIGNVKLASPFAIVNAATNNLNQFIISRYNVTQIALNSVNALELGSEFSQYINEYFQDLDKDLIYNTFIKANFTGGRNEILVHIPITNDTDYSTILVFDLNTKSWVKRYQQAIRDMATYKDKLYSCTEDGKLLQEYSGNDFDGTDIDAYFITDWQDFPKFPDKVEVDDLYLNLNFEADNNFNLTYYFDFDITNTREVTINKKQAGTLYWNDGNWDEKNWASATSIEIKSPARIRSFKSIKFKISATTSSQDFFIKQLLLSNVRKL